MGSVSYLVVFAGAGLGGMARHGINLAVLRLGWAAFPFGTLLINVLGSVLIGAITALFALKAGLPRQWQLFLATGIMGGFTTFSTFSLETAVLYERGRLGLALAYVLASVALSIGGLFAALALVRALVRP